MPPPLAHRVSEDANAAQIAEAVAAAWQEIEAGLTPIIGKRGVAALYTRSLFLNTSAYPWLAKACDSAQTILDTSALNTVLAQRDRSDAAECGGAVLQTFHELLTTLIGPSLTERLLRSVWANSSNGLP